MDINSSKRKIYTVSQITHEIHETMDSKFSFVWVTGEISNFAVPGSGHFYFSLKDSKAVISAVIFKNQQKNLKFKPKNGLEVVGFGRISIYPPRGTYQLIFEYIEPKGLGSLQLLFEQTKEKLRLEGLFDEKHKKRLPFYPGKITLVTSLSGAALRDMLKTFAKRGSNTKIEIYPVSVQGDSASGQIIEAVKKLNKINTSDIIIIARGGGSFEDLMAFNSEELARAVFDSEIPVVTGVGHETDFTIIDFVSDLRAPTPTAAAEYCVPDKKDLEFTLGSHEKRLRNAYLNNIERKKDILKSIARRLDQKDPKKEIDDLRLYLDDKTNALIRRTKRIIESKKDRLKTCNKSLTEQKLLRYYNLYQSEFNNNRSCLLRNFEIIVNRKRSEFENLFARLYELGPYTILKRGYSITRKKDSKKILRSVDSGIKKNDEIEVVLSDGMLICSVNEISKKES